MTAAATEPSTDPGSGPGPDPDELVVCPKCQSGNDSDAKFCDQCGFDLTSTGFRPADYLADDDETVKCPACGLMDDPDAKFCDQCGADLSEDNPTSQKPADAPDDSAPSDAAKAATKEAVSDKPWSDFPDSAFSDEQYAKSCILDRGADFSDSAKQRYSLPCREPDGTLNRNACHNAAAVLGGARGGVANATPEQKKAAASKLAAYYRQSLDEDVPQAVLDLAGKARQGVGIKDARVRIKAGPDDNLPEGTFTAYASVFGNTDSFGDVVKPGAFSKTLSQWEESGNPIPLLFGHNMSDPDYNIGAVTKAVEDDHGLLVTAQLDLDNPKAQQVYRLLKGRRINQMSFAYDVMDAKAAKADDGSAINELHDLRLYEVSVVTVGANQETEVLAVKHALEGMVSAAKAGRTLSAANEASLRQAADLITSVLKSVDSGSDSGTGAGANDQGKASGHARAKTDASDEDRLRGKSSVSAEEPTFNPSADTHLALISTYL